MLKFGPNWFSKPHSRKKSGSGSTKAGTSVSFADPEQQPPKKLSRKARKKPLLVSGGQQQFQQQQPSPESPRYFQHQVSWASESLASEDLFSGSVGEHSNIFSRQSSVRQSGTSAGSHSRRAFYPPPRRPTKNMVDTEKEEAINLQVEFEWVLHEEVHSVLKQLHAILVECCHRFPVPLYHGHEEKKQDKFILTAAPEQLKCVVTLTGDSITHADINFKVQRQQQQTQRTSITQDYPWKIQQVQDAANHLQQAINHIENVDSSYHFKTSDEVLHILGNILGALQRGRTSLVVPRKKPIDELMKSRNMKALSPNLPEDLAISFYIQSHKLIFVAYQLTNFQGTMKFDSCQAECSVPWLNEVLVLFTVALQLCQQLKDKISVFSQYKDFTVGSRSPSALSY
ncbi:protein rogdi isoform X2 [Uranotaenia lowii]|uniref:protein rogdi isoform X2 n=1 Tax=Uranotaenia lowii TaxID=190385 RepID=UPI002479944B|nr:protein rogdi isoform X2 [Uranotaenia lowii]